MRAPYSSWAQLQYLENHPKQLIHTVCAGLDMLMFVCERVITSFDFVKGFFSFVDKGKLLFDLGVSAEMFLDVAIISGFDWIETFPVIDVKQGMKLYIFNNKAVTLSSTLLMLSISVSSLLIPVKTSSVFAFEQHPRVLALV
jgi:hypothetical protein